MIVLTNKVIQTQKKLLFHLIKEKKSSFGFKLQNELNQNETGTVFYKTAST